MNKDMNFTFDDLTGDGEEELELDLPAEHIHDIDLFEAEMNDSSIDWEDDKDNHKYKKDKKFYDYYISQEIHNPDEVFKVGEKVYCKMSGENESQYYNAFESSGYTVWDDNSEGVIEEIIGLAALSDDIVYKIKVTGVTTPNIYAYARGYGITRTQILSGDGA